PLRFPEADGSFGQTIQLDFGPSLQGGGNGTDGVTDFSTGTTGQERLPTLQYLPFWSCEGEPTSSVSPSWCPGLGDLTDTATAAWPTAAAATSTVYDAAAQPWSIEFYWRAAGVNRLEYKYVVAREQASIESGVGALKFANDGSLQHSDPAAPVRLPLADGSAGPLIAFDLGLGTDQGGTGYDEIFAVQGTDPNPIYLNADGMPNQCPQQ
ncbi:MAG: hypothetical protein ABI335_27900, partial [Polyangiaceae bacterium]